MPRYSARQIRRMILDDFNVMLTLDEAQTIADARARGCVSWNTDRLINTAGDAIITRIDAQHVHEHSTRTSVHLWNRARA